MCEIDMLSTQHGYLSANIDMLSAPCYYLSAASGLQTSQHGSCNGYNGASERVEAAL